MATGWLKSLHCKSSVVQDVCHHSHRHQKIPLSPSQRKKPKPRKPTNPSKQSTPTKQSSSPHNQRLPNAKPTPTHFLTTSPSPFPTLVSLPHGDSSRRIIEIIFTSSWSSSPFPGVIDLLFKVHNPPVSLALFEAHRSAVRARAGPSDARCAADGNEMMRFHTPQSAVPLEQPVFDAGLLRWCSASSVGGVRTFAGSGGAHDSDGEETCRKRRRAMVVCRVIAGRVGKDPDKGPDVCESVALGKGELLVFDRSALLPCFLVIYRL